MSGFVNVTPKHLTDIISVYDGLLGLRKNSFACKIFRLSDEYFPGRISLRWKKKTLLP